MLDKERILTKIDELNCYLNELKQILPNTFNEYKKIEKKRSSERLVQLCIECVIDICKLFISGLKLGLPTGEDDLFEKMAKNKIIPQDMVLVLKEMRGFRNILIHEYTALNDELVYNSLKTKLNDFEKFKREIMPSLK